MSVTIAIAVSVSVAVASLVSSCSGFNLLRIENSCAAGQEQKGNK
jgi:hypothetical protein